MAVQWGYKDDNGPAKWHNWFPIATGSRQSPVDIVTGNCTTVTGLEELSATYSSAEGNTLVNTGASWKLNLEPEGSSLTGGPLQDEYKVLQLHAHWGQDEGEGSEHTLDGKSFDGEVHIVHFNTKYGDAATATDKPDGLAVLGMFIKIGDEHSEIEKFIDAIGDVVIKNDEAVVKEAVNPGQLLPGNKSYYTYPGSLTTPPLFESVTWIVFKQPIEMSNKQLSAMRDLKTGQEDCDCMVRNYRPPCPLGERIVRVVEEEEDNEVVNRIRLILEVGI